MVHSRSHSLVYQLRDKRLGDPSDFGSYLVLQLLELLNTLLNKLACGLSCLRQFLGKVCLALGQPLQLLKLLVGEANLQSFFFYSFNLVLSIFDDLYWWLL